MASAITDVLDARLGCEFRYQFKAAILCFGEALSHLCSRRVVWGVGIGGAPVSNTNREGLRAPFTNLPKSPFTNEETLVKLA